MEVDEGCGIGCIEEVNDEQQGDVECMREEAVWCAEAQGVWAVSVYPFKEEHQKDEAAGYRHPPGDGGREGEAWYAEGLKQGGRAYSVQVVQGMGEALCAEEDPAEKHQHKGGAHLQQLSPGGPEITPPPRCP